MKSTDNKKIIMKQIIILTLIISSFSFNLLAQQVIEFKALSEPFHILTQDDVNAKLDEYDVDELEADGFIAIISDDVTEIGMRAFDIHPWQGGNLTNQHLLEVSGKNVETIGWEAFYGCFGLTSIDFPNAITIKPYAFKSCTSLVSIYFPNVITIEGTVTNYRTGIFSYVPTYFADLTLGEYVTPKPDLTTNWWHYGIVFPYNRVDYYWRTITVVSSIEEIIKNQAVNIYPNPTTEYFTVSFELKKMCYLEIDLFDIQGDKIQSIYNDFAMAELFTTSVNTENLARGTYFIKISIDKDYIIKKIVVN